MRDNTEPEYDEFTHFHFSQSQKKYIYTYRNLSTASPFFTWHIL